MCVTVDVCHVTVDARHVTYMVLTFCFSLSQLNCPTGVRVNSTVDCIFAQRRLNSGEVMIFIARVA